MKTSRKKQISGVLTLCLCTLLLIGLCTNALVFPFVNLAAATAKKTENLIPALSKPTESSSTPALSFFEMLTHFGAQDGKDKTLSGELYGADTTLVLAPAESANLPAVGRVGDLPALQARLGFLVRRNADGTRTLLDENARVLLDVMPEEMDFTGAWDQNEHAVFSSADGYVYYDREQGAFLPSDYDPNLTTVTGVDLPVYYERPDSRIALSYKDGYYGYFYTDTGEANYQYTHTGKSYQFREGYGALGTDSGIIIVNYVARRFFFSWGTLLQPETEGLSSLGYYRMDHGLLMVDRQTDDGRERLILTEDNRLFYLPKDFNLVCYSDGVFLLEKGGRYGYLDYTGRWIADPVYREATPFFEGLCAVRREDGKIGVLDTAGGVVVPFEFDEISISGGVIALYNAGRWFVVHKVQ